MSSLEALLKQTAMMVADKGGMDSPLVTSEEHDFVLLLGHHTRDCYLGELHWMSVPQGPLCSWNWSLHWSSTMRR
jgi:hypothetical protein